VWLEQHRERHSKQQYQRWKVDKPDAVRSATEGTNEILVDRCSAAGDFRGQRGSGANERNGRTDARDRRNLTARQRIVKLVRLADGNSLWLYRDHVGGRKPSAPKSNRRPCRAFRRHAVFDIGCNAIPNVWLDRHL
jgi:hypothetical protein